MRRSPAPAPPCKRSDPDRPNSWSLPDPPRDHADALLDLAEVLAIRKDHEGAREAAREALDLYEQKGIVSGRERAERYLSNTS